MLCTSRCSQSPWCSASLCIVISGPWNTDGYSGKESRQFQPETRSFIRYLYAYGRHVSGGNHGQVGYCGQKCQHLISCRSLGSKVSKSYLKIHCFYCCIVLAKTAWLPYRDSKADISTMPLYQYKNRLKLMKTMIAGQFTWVVREVIILWP